MCVWVEDADKLELGSKELNVVYVNKFVNSFINNTNTLGLAAVKGQGKTFLIKVKRKQLEENNTVLCLPRNKMVDIVDSSLEIEKSLFNYLHDYNVWVQIWKFSICGAILSTKENQDFFNETALKSNARNFIQTNNKRSEPSSLIRALFRLNIQELKIILTETGKLFDMVMNLHHGVCIFIDKIDQGFSNYAKNFNEDSRLPSRSRNASFWQYAQYALAEAAYDIYAGNHHVKVIYTIRQEALIDSERLNKDKARNINSYMVSLLYNRKELYEMYKLYIKNETPDKLALASCIETEPSKAFIGFETIPHGYVSKSDENVFDYIYRHTFKRPYDIMRICHKLSLSDRPTEKDIRHLVNLESNELLKQYIRELSIFLPCSEEEIDQISLMIPCNLLDLTAVNTLCGLFFAEKNEQSNWTCNRNCVPCHSFNIFSVLFNIGLIGYEKQSPADKNPIISFENIGNRVLQLKFFSLPASKFYYLHPALSEKVQQLRESKGLVFRHTDAVVIGDGYEIGAEKRRKYGSEKIWVRNEIKKETVFVSSTIFDLENERLIIKKTLQDRGFHPVMSEEKGAFDIYNAQKMHSHDLCILNIEKCKSFIFIVGEKYGGEYAGLKYKKEKDEIISLSSNKIPKPSISLMEYYIARKKGLKCYVFSSRALENKKRDFEKKLLNSNRDISSEECEGDIAKIKYEIDFINHLKLPKDNAVRGNWIEWYEKPDDLPNSVSRCKFI